MPHPPYRSTNPSLRKGYYLDVEEWHHEYLGSGVWEVVVYFADGVLSRWRVYEETTAVDPVALRSSVSVKQPAIDG